MMRVYAFSNTASRIAESWSVLTAVTIDLGAVKRFLHVAHANFVIKNTKNEIKQKISLRDKLNSYSLFRKIIEK